MLPSVSAGSAALTKYAQASVAASEHPSRDPEMPADSDRKTAQHNGERPSAIPAEETLVRETRAAIAALLDLLHSRVQKAALDLGLTVDVADDAARQAVAQVADAIARDGAQAAHIVQTVLDRIDAGDPADAAALLHLVARGLTLVIDRTSGVVETRPPTVEIASHDPSRSGQAIHHLLDVTDASADKAAPVLAALEAAHAAVADAAKGHFAPVHGHSPSAGAPPTLIAPGVFTAPISALLSPYLGDRLGVAAPMISQLATAISSVLVSAATSTTAISVADVAAAVGSLRLSTTFASGDADADTGSGGDAFRLISGATGLSLNIAVQPENGSVTVTVGDRVVALSPAALPPAAVLPAPTEEALDAASLPVRDISPNIPTGSILERPAGTPFIPPEIAQMPPPNTPPRALPQSVPASAQTPVAVAQQLDMLPAQTMETARNATVLRGIEFAARSEGPAGMARISLDISADVGPAPTSATLSEKLGRLGRSAPAPAQSEAGPVMQQGYTDGSATNAPVLPAWHVGVAAPLPPAPPARKKLPPRAYRSAAPDDALTRETPPGHEGLVFSSVVFSV